MKKFLIVLIVIWMGFIFSMSSENGEQSSNTSGKTIEIVLEAVPEKKEQPKKVKKDIVNELQFIVRKSAHFIAYMILGILVGALVLNFLNIEKQFLLAWGVCVIYAMSDEFHQLFVPGRTCKLTDVLIDSSGSLLGICIVIIFVNQFKKLRNKTQLS